MRAAALALLLVALPLGAQKRRASAPDQISVEAGAGFGSIYFEEGNGTTVRGGVAPVLGVEALWATGRSLRAGFAVRASRDALRISDDGRSWGAGHATRFDLYGTLAWDVERIAFRVAAGPAWLSGPDDVVPFRAQGTAMHWGGGVTVDGALAFDRRLRWRAGVDGLRMTPSGTATTPVTGMVHRFMIGAAYAL